MSFSVLEPVFWSPTFFNEDSTVALYVAATISCATARQASSESTFVVGMFTILSSFCMANIEAFISAINCFFIKGEDQSCRDKPTNKCNGPLPAGRKYNVAYKGSNAAAMKSSMSEFSKPVSVKQLPCK